MGNTVAEELKQEQPQETPAQIEAQPIVTTQKNPMGVLSLV